MQLKTDLMCHFTAAPERCRISDCRCDKLSQCHVQIVTVLDLCVCVCVLYLAKALLPFQVCGCFDSGEKLRGGIRLLTI